MILRIVLFLLYTALVSSNNGSPVIPEQTYPFYQQNGYPNQPNQPSDLASYLQNMMVQNQLPSTNLSPSNIRQMLLNRLLSNQPLQTNFDQNAGGYGSNLVGYPNNPNAANAGNVYYGAPVLENYQTPSTNNDEKPKDTNTEGKRKKHKRRRSKSRRRQGESKAYSNNSINEQTDDTEDDNTEVTTRSKKRSRKQNNESPTRDSSTTHTETENRKHSRTKKRKNKENESKDVADKEIKVENRPRRRRRKKPKIDSNDAEKVPSEKIIPEQNTTSKASKVKQEDLNLEKEGITEENRVARNSKPETNDLLKAIPNLPEGYANAFNFTGLPQFQNNPAMSNFFANYENIYQSMMPKNQETTNVRKNNKLPANRTRPQQVRKIAVKSKNSTVTTDTARSSNSSKRTASPKINVVAKDKTIYINGKKRPNINPMPKNETLKSNDEPSKMENVTELLKNDEIVSKNEEFVNENNKTDNENNDANIDLNLSPDPDYSKGYIEDYYPHFADSMANTANNKEVYVKNLGDTKYYYAVDKGNKDLIGGMRFESFTLPERVPKDYEMNKTYDDIESVKNTSKADIKETREEVIQFRSPPLLESPDFQTRKIERHNLNTDPYYNFSDDENEDLEHRYVGDKSSIYSDAKSPYYTGPNDNAIKTNTEKENKDIETVFARSKVVKYGPVFNPEDSLSAGKLNQGDSYRNDDGVTYVLATSLDQPELYW